ncbi:hypothetical protein WT10_20725 [Burkholderia stagnalis]|nr:hypothetical protein [Burkholderia stagnalis]KVC65718.1 hypothetical protein WS59_13915 [Burkholderia stagnalis]KVN17544.1 hypothetical protein WT10_20725 [Burkholderia stagnalis]KWK70128.1 hypothetical protein WT82_13435 [Burkholderia stagnalis]
MLDFTRLASGISSTLVPTKKFSGNYDTFDQATWANGRPESLTFGGLRRGYFVTIEQEPIAAARQCLGDGIRENYPHPCVEENHAKLHTRDDFVRIFGSEIRCCKVLLNLKRSLQMWKDQSDGADIVVDEVGCAKITPHNEVHAPIRTKRREHSIKPASRPDCVVIET